MNRFKNIFLVVREKHNERGIERAVELAKMNEARLTLIQPATARLATVLDTFKHMESFDRLRTALVGKQEEELKALCDSLEVENVQSIVTTGESAEVAIIQQVLREKHDLVITTAQGSQSALGGLFKSLSLHLLRKCPCPVWIVHPRNPCHVEQILAAVDPATMNNGHSVNSLILDLSTSLAHIDHAKLHIVHAYYELVLEGYEDLLIKYGVQNVPRDVHWTHVNEAIAKRKQDLDTLLAKHPINSVEHEVHLVEGAASSVISQVANDQKVDLLVLGAVTHSEPFGHFIGTTAEDIIHQVGCSVLAVKPTDFVSPITL